MNSSAKPSSTSKTCRLKLSGLAISKISTPSVPISKMCSSFLNSPASLKLMTFVMSLAFMRWPLGAIFKGKIWQLQPYAEKLQLGDLDACFAPRRTIHSKAFEIGQFWPSCCIMVSDEKNCADSRLKTSSTAKAYRTLWCMVSVIEFVTYHFIQQRQGC